MYIHITLHCFIYSYKMLILHIFNNAEYILFRRNCLRSDRLKNCVIHKTINTNEFVGTYCNTAQVVKYLTNPTELPLDVT